MQNIARSIDTSHSKPRHKPEPHLISTITFPERTPMRAFSPRLGLAITLAIGLFAIPAAHADTYQIFDLGSATRTDIVGITASGTAVLVYNVPVGAPLCAVSGICYEYETWTNGVMVNESPTAPDFVYDNGAPCTADAPFLT